MWRELIAGLTPHAEFTQPASEDFLDDNTLFRSNPDFRGSIPLLFFADVGNGDQFAFVSIPRRDNDEITGVRLLV